MKYKIDNLHFLHFAKLPYTNLGWYRVHRCTVNTNNKNRDFQSVVCESDHQGVREIEKMMALVNRCSNNMGSVVLPWSSVGSLDFLFLVIHSSFIFAKNKLN